MKAKKAKENHAGRLGDLTVDGLSFGVRITEGPRGAYGRLDLKVEPLNGAGTCWVKSDRVTLRAEVDHSETCGKVSDPLPPFPPQLTVDQIVALFPTPSPETEVPA